MKKILVSSLVSVLLLLILSVTALAQGELDTIYNSKNHLEMFEEMKSVSSLSEQVKKVESLTGEQQNNLLTGLYIRRKNPKDIAEFKEFFEQKFKEATTYMSFIEGYPKIKDNGEHGCTMTVLTDVSGYVYIVAFPDNVTGGINGYMQFMQYYNEDNGLYKKKVYVEAGIEKTFPISCASYGSGSTYRAYMCLRTEHNCFSEFRQIKYTVKKIVPKTLIIYRLGDYFLVEEGRFAEYFLQVCSNKPYEYWEAYYYHFEDTNGNILYDGNSFCIYEPYTLVNTFQDFTAGHLDDSTRLVMNVRFYMSDGSTYENAFVLEYKDSHCTIQTYN